MQTPLYEAHCHLKAKMVDFHGWQLPLHYGSQLEEHTAVREKAGMFDVSHMTVVDVLGAGSRQFLRSLLANDVDRIQHIGGALYTTLCTEHGGIVDDLIVYQRASDNYRLVLNAATKKRDLEWLHDKVQGFAAGLQERTELAMIAIQGPEAVSLTMSVLHPAQQDAISTLQRFECVEVEHWFFARTGYTGEDGLEVMLPAEQANAFWDALYAAGVKPCGLGARDSLRLEAGLLLYGQDMDETTNPLESALSWTVAFEPMERDFIGKGALLSAQRDGVRRKLVGLTLDGAFMMRHGQRVMDEAGNEGVITSGSYSPTQKKSFAFARVPVAMNGVLHVDIRGKWLPVTMGKLRFL